MVQPDTTRNDLPQYRQKPTDQDAAFKKAYQVVDKPPVTEHDIHEDYMKDPPRNEPTELTTERKARGLKEGAWEEDPKESGVLGEFDEATGRVPKEAALRDLALGSPDDV